ncbi:MAG: hypothetical protein ACTSVY_10315 [Candidatus Helarchaeota archaeon]
MIKNKDDKFKSIFLDGRRVLIIHSIQLFMVAFLPIIFYLLIYKIFPTIISPYYIVASFVFFTNRDNKILNSFILTSVFPLIYALISFPFDIIAIIFHSFPIMTAILILHERKINIVGFVIFSFLTFFMYYISVTFKVYPQNFSIIPIGLISWIINFFLIISIIEYLD